MMAAPHLTPSEAASAFFALYGPNGTALAIDVLIERLDALQGDADYEDACDDDTEAVDERERDDSEHSFGDIFGADPAQRDRIRRTRCRPRYGQRWQAGDWRPFVIGYELRREPTVPRSIKRLRRTGGQARR